MHAGKTARHGGEVKDVRIVLPEKGFFSPKSGTLAYEKKVCVWGPKPNS